MTKKVTTVRDTDTTTEIASTFEQNHINGAPVVDDIGRMVGIVSSSDLIEAARVSADAKAKAQKVDRSFKPRQDTEGSAAGIQVSLGGVLALLKYKLGHSRGVEKNEVEGDSFRHLRARDIMSIDLYTIRAEDPARMAVEMMVRRGINRLPVVNEKGEPIGVVTRADIIQALSSAREVTTEN